MIGAESERSTAENYRRFARLEVRGKSPLYEALALGVSGDDEILGLLETLPRAKRQPNLLFAAARFLFGTPSDFPAFRRRVLRDAGRVLEVMRSRRTQTNEPARCAVLLPLLAALPQPLALIEVGAAAGLCLLPDAYGYRYGGRGVGAGPPVLRCEPRGPVPVPSELPRVAWRIGVDLEPLDVSRPGDVGWLEALVWPGQDDRLARLRAAVAIARANPPRVVRGDALEVLPDVAARAPAGATPVVFHSAFLPYLDAAGRARFESLVRGLGAIWIANEAPGLLPSVAAGLPGGPGREGVFALSLDGVAVALADPHGAWVRWLDRTSAGAHGLRRRRGVPFVPRMPPRGGQGMVCAGCGAENRTGGKFCAECGAPLARACPSCGHPAAPAAKFCDECGAPLTADGDLAGAPARSAARSPADAPPVAERRLVSILFADLVGFTTHSESRDPEEVRELLSRYFETCRGVVERYGGEIEKFIGDAVMAVWGAPVATEDDAERAVRAGLDLVEAVAALGMEVGAPGLAVRGGVLTGEAAVNLGARGQGMVAGDLVNTASRIQSAAEPGTVLVGEATFHASRGAIAFEEAGELSLKGKAEPVRAWRARRVIGQRKGVGRTEGLEPQFVGRDEELRLIKGLLHATARERRARLVSVTGIPGIGKSRLAWEFLKYVDGLAETIYWHQGRSPAYGEGVTFWALGEMVRMRARIAESDEPAQARTRLSATVAEFVEDPEERRWVEPRLAHLLGLAEAPPGEREELYSAWRTFFERVAARGPVVMVFEDLQWADAGLVDFVESILEWSRNHPILVVTLARPELAERRPTWGAGQRSFTSLHLEPLTEGAMRELLEGFVPGLPREMVGKILERAEGVPLYAVETIRMLADRGALVQREGAYEVAGELGDLSVPGTLHALIASRLDALAPAERSLLQDASVLGASFTTDGLAAVTGTDAATIEARLRDLVRKEMLTLDADPRSPERGQYGFVQSLIREVAYSTLARADRRAKHLATAHHFESLGDEELAGVVAAHYVEAHRESPEGPEAEALAARARDWLSQAGERALSLGSPEQALAFFEQALEVTPEGTERAALLERAGEAAQRAAVYERAVDLLEEAIAHHERAGDVTAAGLATARLGWVLAGGLRRFSEANERSERALAAVGEEGDERARAELSIGLSLGQSNASAGTSERALEWAEIALPLAERLDDADLLSRAIGAKAAALYDLGRHREATMLARGRVAMADSSGSLRERAHGRMQLSLYVQDEDPRECLRAALEAAELARRSGDRGLETLNLLNAAETAIFIGELADARRGLADAGATELSDPNRAWSDLLDAILAALTGGTAKASAVLERLAALGRVETEYVSARTTYLRARSMVHLVSGDLEEARRDAAATVAIDPAGINAAFALAIQARAALWLHDPDGAREALAGMEGFRGRWMAAARETVRSGVAALEERREDAAAGYRHALEGWRALEAPLDLALCGLDMVALLGADHREAAAAGGEARAILERLGATPLLERLDREAGVHNVPA